ncbi:hypothetical protein AB5J52_26415 [Streptomyces sp. R39]|uniref:SAM-dependent methyltransferase n=1 Tax=Streptomyces sp. R39 TaxID=3238631 RepID=A0AB39QT81_9ACTN
MYLAEAVIAGTFRRIARLAAGSTLVTTFLRPIEDVEPDQREQLLAVQRGARASGTPFLSFCTPERMAALAREAGFRDTRHVPAEELAGRYFAGPADGLRPSRGEEILVALT